MMQAIAEDWYAELRDFPAWAIQDACRWWMGAENGDRRKRPMPGDIAELARKKTSCVRVAARRLQEFQAGSSNA
ncbi:hypothetical protein QEZ52_00395 [Aliisedimentitalea scapharcae]|uniref:Uncharacterized protein n=1 Tax=Aliisedimentitalea scapharcae TaxID=1524259 RepID=A0ABZ2XT56_9RHOB